MTRSRQVRVQVRKRQRHLCHSLLCLHPTRRMWQQQAMAKSMSTWSGGVEDADDSMPAPTPTPRAAHIPIDAGQVLCVPETFLPALNLERNRKDPIHTLLGCQREGSAGQRSRAGTMNHFQQLLLCPQPPATLSPLILHT